VWTSLPEKRSWGDKVTAKERLRKTELPWRKDQGDLGSIDSCKNRVEKSEASVPLAQCSGGQVYHREGSGGQGYHMQIQCKHDRGGQGMRGKVQKDEGSEGNG